MADPLNFRPATDSELRWVQSTWTRTLKPSTWSVVREGETRTVVANGQKRVVPKVPRERKYVSLRKGRELQINLPTWKRAHTLLVDDLLEGATVIVIDVHSENPVDPIGWVAFDPDRNALHYAFVADYARRNGVARRLVRYALEHLGPDPEITHKTAAADRLIDSARAGLTPIDPEASGAEIQDRDDPATATA